jgi:CheY-like chemotaxis protein
MPDAGTVFRVVLPLAQDLREERTGVHWSSTGSRGETLLLVEDDESVRTSTVRLLSAFGYTVVAASGGEEAIAFIRQHPETVSLALIDVIMPGLNGAEVYKTLHAISPKLKVIFLSGYPQDVLQDRQLGDIPYIAKPIMPKELFARIEQILASGGSQ